MLDRLSKSESVVHVKICGDNTQVPAGISAAAAILSTEDIVTRHSLISGQPRAPLCMMGVCFECLLEVDGQRNVLGCQIIVEDGMEINRESGLGTQ